MSHTDRADARAALALTPEATELFELERLRRDGEVAELYCKAARSAGGSAIDHSVNVLDNGDASCRTKSTCGA